MKPKTLPIDKGKIEAELTVAGLCYAGVDEVGRGCIAGPVFAGAAYLDIEKLLLLDDKDKLLIRDSKTLSAKQRIKALEVIGEVGISVSSAAASVAEIETLGIVPATHLAMRRALTLLDINIDVVLVDGNQQISQLDTKQRCIVSGDALCYCIAAASIRAKVDRDAYMNDAALKHPNYGFEKHVGYGTSHHMQQLKKLGATSLHRKNFAPVAKAIARM